MPRMYKLYRNNVDKLGEMGYTGSTAGKCANGGTCGDDVTCEGFCYALRGDFMFPSVRNGLAKMAHGYRYELERVFADFRSQIDNARKPFAIVRINHSGDFVSIDHLMQWVYLAQDYPHIRFYMYSKRYDFLRMMWDAIGELPDNLFYNHSICGEYGRREWDEFKHHRNVNAFIVDERGHKVERGFTGGKVCRCKSYDVNGKRDPKHPCSDCKLCFGGKNGYTYGLEIHCYEH